MPNEHLRKVIGFLGDHLMVRDEDTGRHSDDVEVFIKDDGSLVAYSKEDPNHPDNSDAESVE